ncbi:phosphotransferase [Providencia huaxiensis]|uniref:phosphotransferase n=1 Tax=Providencia huaxiensis TaxID=2027290 RepID=UPI002431BB3E|nr:phosphotransferase [Providencia huaxiensis]
MSPLAGLSGGSYLLQCSLPGSQVKLIARADGNAQTALYVNRKKEARILQQLRAFSFTPKVIGRNSQWLLLGWCEGQHPDNHVFLQSSFQCELANIVTQLHRAPLLGYHLQLRDEISHYGYLIDKKRFSPRWKKLHHHFTSADFPKTLKLAPAHMDIHAKNIVCTPTGRLLLLDWEYAANTDIAFSLETYFQFNGLSDIQRDFFLTQYCDIHGAYRDKQQLAESCQLWAPWVKYMTLMWYEVQWHESQSSDFLLHSQSLRKYFGLLG